MAASISVFEHEPDLLISVSRTEVARARKAGIAPLLALERGPWVKTPTRPSDSRHLGHLVIDGLLSYRVEVGGRESIELVGPGDVLRPWVELNELSIPVEVRWHVEAAARLAVLDPGFARRITAWPEVVAALMDRLTLRVRWLATELAVSSARRVDTRLLLALWYCADRWGKVTPAGVAVRLPLTHELLAEIIGARRPSVSAAAAELERQGRLARLPERGWVLFGEPPATVESLEKQLEREGV